ncbi:MAG TPA: cell division protein FtsZ [Candidatus Saccharimonadales bacterium]|nr:cell division protein FtsZ [Candidatus Saccharimonadales bacterium]
MPQVDPAIETFARIKVVGVGGAGGAAINRMVDAGITGVDFVAINTDAQALHNNKANQKVHIGKETSKGLGVGADPELGQKAAEESLEDIDKAVAGADMVFVTLGAGGGTGSGAGHLVAKAAQDGGALVVGFATKPFAFEGEKRRRNAEVAIEKLSHNVDTMIVIPNDKLLQTIDRRTPLLEAFKVADDVLRQGVQGISDLITVHGLVNLDFADVRTVMASAGTALMGIGRASGENRAIEAATQAISSPLLEVSIDGARGILFNVIGGLDVSMHEINTVAETITAAADEEANIIFGATINPDLEGELIVTVVATGFDDAYYARRNQTTAKLLKRVDDADQPLTPAVPVDEATMAEIDMDLKEKAEAHDFHSDETPNIWTLSDEQNMSEEARDELADKEIDKPSFLRRFGLKKDKPKEDKPADDIGHIVSDDQVADEPVDEPADEPPTVPVGENETPATQPGPKPKAKKAKKGAQSSEPEN